MSAVGCLSAANVLDIDSFETFDRDNVTLVDVEASPIVEITRSGIRTSDATYDRDVIVFAGGMSRYRERCDQVVAEGYDGFVIGSAQDQ